MGKERRFAHTVVRLVSLDYALLLQSFQRCLNASRVHRGAFAYLGSSKVQPPSPSPRLFFCHPLAQEFDPHILVKRFSEVGVTLGPNLRQRLHGLQVAEPAP